jgi:hypothetical protein
VIAFLQTHAAKKLTLPVVLQTRVLRDVRRTRRLLLYTILILIAMYLAAKLKMLNAHQFLQ